MPRNGSQTLSDLQGDYLRIRCTKCDRKGRYTIDRLWRERGPDLMLTSFLDEVSADCPRRGNVSLYDQCGAAYDFDGA